MGANKNAVDSYLSSRGFDQNVNVNFTNYNQAQGSAVANPKASGFVGNVGKSLAGVAGFAGKTAYGVAEGFGKGVGAWGHNLVGEVQQLGKGGQMNRQVERGKQLQAAFNAGKITAKEYEKEYGKLLAENKKTVAEKAAIKKKQLSTLDLAKASGETALNVGALVASAGFGQGRLAKYAGSESKAVSAIGKTGQFAGRVGGMDTSANAGTALLKSQLVVKPNIQTIPQIGKDLSTGNYGSAALNAGLLASGGLEGGPLKALGSLGSKITTAASKVIYDTHGLYDVLTLKGGKSFNENFNAAKKALSPARIKKDEGILKVWQDHVIQKYGNRPDAAARVLEEWQPDGKKFADMTYKEAMGTIKSIMSDKRKLTAVAKKAGLKIPEGTNVVAARLTQETRGTIADRLSKASNPLDEFAKLKKEGLIKGPVLPGQIEDIIKSGKTGDLLSKEIRSFNVAVPALVDGAPVITKDGRFLAFAEGAEVVKKANQVADIVQGKKATFGVVGRALDKVGLSTKAADPAEQKAIFGQVKDNFTKAINANSDIKLTGKEIMNRLNKYTETKPGIFDLRQLRKGEIAGVLGVDKAQAATILKEYNNAFKSLSTADRGLAGKITDFNMRNNPLAPGYSRIQSVFRYERNPFFRIQENIETRAGVAGLTGKNAMVGTDKYNDVVKTLRDNGVFKDYFAGPASEGAAGLGAISAKLSKDQENVLAGALVSMAGDKKKVMSFIADPKNASMMQDLKAIVQYPDKGFTSSNFMKAMNLAVFPMRYNLKVTSLAAKALAKQPGATQVAVIRGLNDFNNWQKTPAGIKWNSDNSEALGVLRYFTPIGSVESILNILGGNAKTIRDYGTVGGLPFGVISAVLQGQGAVNLDSPYLDPKTGEVVPNKVPKDLKARANQALVDILGTMFTFPGRQVNFDSKRKISQGIVDNVTQGALKGGKTESVTRTDLTPEQKRTQAVLQAGNNKNKIQTPSNKPILKPVSISSSKPVVITPKFKPSKAKKGKTRAIPVGRFQP